MANREIPGQGGNGLVVVDSDYRVRSSMEGATIVCRAPTPVTVELLNASVPGVDFTVINRSPETVTVTSLTGDLFADGDTPLSGSIIVRQNETVHVVYDVTLRQWQVGRGAGVDQILVDIDTIFETLARHETATKLLALATAIPGFATEFRITEPTYPYLDNQNIDFRLQRLDTTTFRCLETGPLYFPAGGFGSTVAETVITLPQTDVSLTTLDVGPANGIFVRYVGCERDGSIVFADDSLSRSRDVIQLGVIVVKQVAGVVTFLDELVNSPVRTQPNLTCVDNFVRTLAPLTTQVQVAPNGANLLMLSRTGSIIGEGINWGSEINAHSIIRPGNEITPFYRVSAGTAAETTLGGVFTLIDPTRYWNGSALVLLGAPNNASVQRVLITATGGVLVQFGEVQYANLQDAIDNIYSASFTTSLPITFAVEIARVAMTRSAIALNDNAQALWVRTGGHY